MVRISSAGEVIHLYSLKKIKNKKDLYFSFFKVFKAEGRNYILGSRDALSPWTVPCQEYLHLLHISCSYVAQCNMFSLGAGRGRALSLACI